VPIITTAKMYAAATSERPVAGAVAGVVAGVVAGEAVTAFTGGHSTTRRR
jgi:hypothetical protein